MGDTGQREAAPLTTKGNVEFRRQPKFFLIEKARRHPRELATGSCDFCRGYTPEGIDRLSYNSQQHHRLQTN